MVTALAVAFKKVARTMALDILIGVALVLGIIILVHEWGHFIVARLFGVRVDVFSIGFGPRLFGWKRGATYHRVSALHFGGYVRMSGQVFSEDNSKDVDPPCPPIALVTNPHPPSSRTSSPC